jgi:hypothetical protein
MCQFLEQLDPSAFAELLEHLKDKRILMNKYRKASGEGRSQAYGMVRKRSMAPDLSRCSWLDPRLHYLLMKFARQYVPIPFTSVQVNDSYQTAKHKDKHNFGDSLIVGFGDYTDGELVVDINGTEETFDIHHRPLIFNGSELPHYTKPFTGRRFSLVFHTIVAPEAFPMVRKLEEYEAVCVDGAWKIAFREPGMPVKYLDAKNGLDHPLKGRKKKLTPIAEESPAPFHSAAQNLLSRALSAQQHRFDN